MEFNIKSLAISGIWVAYVATTFFDNQPMNIANIRMGAALLSTVMISLFINE